jgi:rhodanese-related sulfurtransferase
MTTTDPQTTPSAVIDVAELERLRAEDPALHVLDVRTPGEFDTAHIPGAYNVPVDVLGEHVRDLAALDHPVVLVCQSGARATKAMEALVAAGKSNLRLLQGGMNAWNAAGKDVNRGAERWSLERQVRLVAGTLVFTSVLASLAFPPAVAVAGFVGAGLTFASVTNTCAMGMLLAKLPYNRGPACDMDAVLDQLVKAESR